MSSETKIGFTKTENAILQSEQLSKNEKWFYTVLKSFRHNSPPIRCNPSLPTIEQRADLAHHTVLKVRKLLEIKGLIKIESKGAGAGRTKTNNYIFPLEDGTDEQKQRLLAYLRVKRNSAKEHRFKGKKTVQNGTVLEEKNSAKFNKKTVQKSTSNNKVLTRSIKEQQQGKGKNPDVVAPSLNQKEEKPKPVVKDNDSTANLIARLQKLGITKDKAVELLANHLYENVEKQVEWLPYRESIKNPAGALIRAVEQNWPEPVTTGKGAPREWKESLKFKRVYAGYWESQKAMLKIAKEDLKKGAGPGRIREWLDKLDPEYHEELKKFVRKLNKYKGVYE